MEIRLAIKEDLNLIMNMLKNCKNDMLKKGNDQWDDEYPNKQIIEQDIKFNNLYTIIENSTCIAIVAINEDEAPEYKYVKWNIDDSKPLVIHRLAVNPDFQGRGIAKNIMIFAEEKAKKENRKSIRLDTYCKNTIAISFYEKLGYTVVGQVHFKNKELHFKCFEKIIHKQGAQIYDLK